MNYWGNFLKSSLPNIEFLEPNIGATKFYTVTYQLNKPIFITNEDNELREGMEFLKNAFEWFYNSNHEKFLFHEPMLILEPPKILSLSLQLFEKDLKKEKE